ncbi:hypothetical protein TeGR_g7248, partial [Tetraparma gracilis]
LTQGRRTSTASKFKYTTRPQIFDNSTTMYPSIVVETALQNARKKESDSHQTLLDREAITFSISVSRHWASTNQHFNPFFQLLRDSIVDFGGELLSCSPLSTTSDDASDGGRGSLVITGVFLTGELPVRQSGGSKNHVEIADAMSHFAAFMYYLLQDESFSDATDIQEDGVRSKSINAISASVGVVSFNISTTAASTCIFASPAIDDTIAILASVPKNPNDPKIYATPKFTTTIQSLPDFSHSPPPVQLDPSFHDVTSLVTAEELVNPGIAMPLSFVRRFHNEAELEYANEWLRKGVAPVLTKTLTEGDALSLAHGGCHQSSIIAVAFSISDASNPRATLSQFRAVLDAVATEFGEHGGGIMSSTTSPNSLQLMGYLAVPITSAAFFVSNLSGRFQRHSSRQSRVDKKGKLVPRANLSACVIHFGDVLWRAGVGGSVIPFGPEVDELTAQFQLLLGGSKEANVSGGGDGNDSDDDQPPASIYCKASVIQEQLELTGESRLIKFTGTEHPDWMVPQDVFTDAVRTVFEGSEMAGRSGTREALSHALSDLLLINASSTTLLEARAGFGKSMLANEIVQVAATLKIPHYIARASEDNESNLHVWVELCAALLRTAENGNGGANVDLLDHLPSGCSTTELYWLNAYLPAEYRVTESMLRAEQNDNSDDDDDDVGKLLRDDSRANVANASVKLQLFGNLLHSLALQVAPFVFVIEDLQWLDSSSWKMLVQSEYWTHGLMMVCTTRPVPLHVADHYTSVCKAPATTRVTLGPLDAADLTSLARRHLASVDMGSVSASMMVIDRLVKLSQGFPFLAEELLREAKADFASSMLGSEKAPDELKDTVSTKERTIAKDPYTPEELLALNEFYSNYERDAGWELFTVESGVEYFNRRNDTGTIRQGKAISTAFFVWRSVFEGVLSLFHTRKRDNGRGFEKKVVSQEVLLAKLDDLIGHDRAKDWHPLLNPLLPFDFSETSETKVLSNTARLELSLDFFYEILENQKEPVLVCLEDAHWCDELSWALIKRCHEAPDVLVVLTSRPEDGGEEKKGTLKEFEEEEGVQRIMLGALEEGALRQHIAELLEVEAISEQLLKLVESRTGGNLLYIQELVSSLIESGMLKYNDKSVDLKSDVDDLVVPDNVQAVIASRLAGLTTSQQSILQTASVIGRAFTLAMVTEVHPASEMLQNLAGDLKEIVRKRLVERIVGSAGGDDADGELQFSHKFVQESIYESCLVSNRKQVHKAIAKNLELDQSKQLSDNYALIAHHYVQAEEWRSACLYLQLSSEVKFASQYGAYICPMLGLTSVSEHLTMEVNRLASQCSGKDAVTASAFVNFANGMAYGGKGELRQAAVFFAAAAKANLEIRDINEWANTNTIGLLMLNECGNLGAVLDAACSTMKKAKETGNGMAIRQAAMNAVLFAVHAGKEDQARMLDLCDGQDQKMITYGTLLWQQGKMSAYECAKLCKKRFDADTGTYRLSFVFLNSSSSNAIATMQLYDYAHGTGPESVSGVGGVGGVGGVSVGEIFKMASWFVKFVEKLAKKYPIALGWAFALRGALLAREGKRGAAMKLFDRAEEAALKISAKACLCYTHLERGYLEDGGAVKRFSSSRSQSAASMAAAVVSPAAEAENRNCIKSFTAAAHLADETGMHRLGDLAKERLRRLNVDTGVEGGITSALVVGVRAPEGGRRASGRRASGRRASGRMVSGRRASGHTHNMDLNAALIKNAGDMEKRLTPVQSGRRMSRKGSAVGFQDDGGK